MRGIFSLLQSLGLSSRYSISSTSPSDRGHPASNLDKYYQSDPTYYFSNSNDPSFQITFDSHFLLLGYSLSNYGSAGNTFPRDWSLYGTNSKDLTNLKLLDRQENQKFCDSNTGCSTSHINMYQTMNVYQKYQTYTTFYFNQTKGSTHYTHLLLRAIDLYGILCPHVGKCYFPMITLQLKFKFYCFSPFVYVIFLF